MTRTRLPSAAPTARAASTAATAPAPVAEMAAPVGSARASDAPPSTLLSQRLPVAPEAVWARVRHSRFIAALLGAELPMAELTPGLCLHGTSADGGPLTLQVEQAVPPQQLTLQLRQAPGQHSSLHLAIRPLPDGCRLQVLHEALPDAPLADTGPLPDATRAHQPAPGAHHAPDDVATLLATPLPAVLQLGEPTSAAALAAAQQHLRQLADAVALVLAHMGPRQGYGLPAGGGFSLAAQLWHLADIETLGWTPRLQRLLTEPCPMLPGVDGDALAVQQRYQQRPWRGAARRFIAQRKRTLAWLARCDAQVLQRPVVFAGQPGAGHTVLSALLAHDQEHREEMAALWPSQQRYA